MYCCCNIHHRALEQHMVFKSFSVFIIKQNFFFFFFFLFCFVLLLFGWMIYCILLASFPNGSEMLKGVAIFCLGELDRHWQQSIPVHEMRSRPRSYEEREKITLKTFIQLHYNKYKVHRWQLKYIAYKLSRSVVGSVSLTWCCYIASDGHYINYRWASSWNVLARRVGTARKDSWIVSTGAGQHKTQRRYTWHPIDGDSFVEMFLAQCQSAADAVKTDGEDSKCLQIHRKERIIYLFDLTWLILVCIADIFVFFSTFWCFRLLASACCIAAVVAAAAIADRQSVDSTDEKSSGMFWPWGWSCLASKMSSSQLF